MEGLEGCDPDAIRYEAHWRPVLEGASLALLGRLADVVRVTGAFCLSPVLLDVGAGTGGLVIPATLRWPGARLVGLDPSAGMLSVARRRAELAGLGDGAGGGGRLTWLAAPAETIPLADGSVDVAMSAFVLQLVQDRAAVLRELVRVLRPGGVLAFVTWLEPHETMPADEEFDEAVVDLAIEEPEAEPEEREDDFQSPESAAHELEVAGFVQARADGGELRYAWTRAAYLRFKEEYDEHHLFGSLDGPGRDRLIACVTERWARLPAETFVFRHPIVTALAVRP